MLLLLQWINNERFHTLEMKKYSLVSPVAITTVLFKENF